VIRPIVIEIRGRRKSSEAPDEGLSNETSMEVLEIAITILGLAWKTDKFTPPRTVSSTLDPVTSPRANHTAVFAG